jgi:membrane protease YdiL (CAAX protease family)
MENYPIVQNQAVPGVVLSEAATPQAWGPGLGLLTWFMSVAFLFMTQLIALVIYLVKTGAMPVAGQIDWLLAMLSIGSAFPAHALTLLFCWLVVTGAGKQPFWQSLGWGWHPQFKWVHATALAVLMMGLAILCSKLLPHQITDLEKLLKLGQDVRILTALMAVLSAPLVEEVVYRGVLYPSIERKWGRMAGVVVTTFLFALVHVPQYWGSWAAITTIVLLSLVLTLVRAWTGSILPGIATHFVYNSIQAVALLLGLDDSLQEQVTETALAVLVKCYAVCGG